MVVKLPRNPERTAMLRKLLEAKDAAVRASIAVDLGAAPPAEIGK
jgi:HEAT repeat protein